MDRELDLDNVEMLQTGRWWIAEHTEHGVAVQGESEQEAPDKLNKRVEDYLSDLNDLEDIRLGNPDYDDPRITDDIENYDA